MSTAAKMTPAELNVAIAKKRGWTNVIFRGIDGELDYVGHHPSIVPAGSSGKWQGPIPNYSGDLNATHEVARTLSHEQKHGVHMSQFTRYQVILGRICNDSLPTEATAAERAEALYEVLCGGREDSK